MKYLKEFIDFDDNWDEEEYPDNELKIGNKVKFHQNIFNDVGFNWMTEIDGIPSKFIIHGGLKYKKNEGTIMEILKFGNHIDGHNEIIYIIKFIDLNNKIVQLGFYEKDFIKI